MKLKTPSKLVLTEYNLAPWHVKLCWWLEARLWWWGKSFEEHGAASPEQAHPFWRKW
jgi:hypothetical protein